MSTYSKYDGFVIDSKYVQMDTNSPVIGYQMRGRCIRCWGKLFGPKDENEKWNVLECRLCGKSVVGDKAEVEITRMHYEAMKDLPKVTRLIGAKYSSDAAFIFKTIPDIVRNKPYFDRRIDAKLKKNSKPNWLSRREFCKGSAGFLYLQACAIMAGTESLARVDSVIPYSEIDLKELNSPIIETINNGTSQRDSVEVNYKFSFSPESMMRNMGSLITLGMNSAFACELALKAILITRNDEAEMTHDLLSLYQDLPDDSKSRLEADFPEIKDVIGDGKFVFGKWRYFSNNAGKKGIESIAHVERAHALAKTARVIIDEGEIAGLAYKVDVDHELEFSSDNPSYCKSQEYKLNISGEESAIPWEIILNKH